MDYIIKSSFWCKITLMEIKLVDKLEGDHLEPLISKYEYHDFRHYKELPSSSLNTYLLRKLLNFSENSQNYILLCEDKNEIKGLIGFTFLEWDSKIFGIKMGKIEYLIATGDYHYCFKIKNRLLKETLNICRERKIKHLSCRIDAEDISGIHALENNNFVLMDTLVTFTFNRHKHKIPNIKTIYPVRKCKSEDLPILIEIAKNAFSNDRFHLDPYLSNEKANILFGEWIKNSFGKDPIFVATRNNIPVGFLTYKLYKDLAQITNFKIMGRGLMAVERSAKGAIVSLMKATFEDVYKNYDCVEYDTRLTNREVIKLCKKFSLELVKIRYTFHKFLNK
jgi:hypothetical protein